jgi:hypothetical protein
VGREELRFCCHIFSMTGVFSGLSDIKDLFSGFSVRF